MNLNFSTFPVLETLRLSLRRLAPEDAQAIYELRSDHEVAKLTGREPARNIHDAKDYIQKIDHMINENSCVFWAISYKDQSALMGTLCFWNFDINNKSIEIGYELLPEFQRRGIMVESLEAIINFGFENIGAEIITAFPSVYNPSSVNVLEKLNFKLVQDTFQYTHENVEGMLTYVLYNSENSSISNYNSD